MFGIRTTQTRCDFIHFSETSPTAYSMGKPALKLVGGSKRTRGKSRRRIAPPAAAKQVRMAPHPASEMRSRRDQMKFPLSASGMPGFPPGIQLPLSQTAEKRGHFLTRDVAAGQAGDLVMRQVAAAFNPRVSRQVLVPRMGPILNFWAIVSVPDNIPIVFMLLLVGYFTYLSFDEARKNDRLIREGRKDQILRRMQ